MKKQCKPKTFLIANALLIFNLLVFFSIRSMWSGIIAIAGKPAPYILMAILTVTTLVTTAFSMKQKYCKLTMIWDYVWNVIFLGLNGYILSVTLDSISFFIREFLSGLLFVGAIAIFIFLAFYSSRITWLQQAWVRITCMCVLVIAGFLICFDISLTNSIPKTPVVYAVNDTYQITFTTKAKGEAWVVIDGKEYNDTYAGYRKTENTIHKIEVPAEVLDNASEYTVYTRAMYLRGPYESLKGSTISKTFSWKGIDDSDGINYYVFSDNHTNTKSPAAAALNSGKSLDFLIACGDTVNWIDTETELTSLLYLASDITKGEIPVIYARGNHETKGVRADEFHNYVGSDGENFYYTFRIKNIWGIVLDVGEDHADDHVEFAGLSKFADYQAKQTAFIEEVLANAATEYNAEGVDYRIGICHIPLTLTAEDDYLTELKSTWVNYLNQMNLDIMYGGHLHELWYIDSEFEDGAILTQIPAYSGKESDNTTHLMTNANFSTILVSRRSDSQLPTVKENVFDKLYIGVLASVEGDETLLKYTNEKGEVVKTISPWFEDIQYEEIKAKSK